MAKCPSCGRRPTAWSLLAISRSRPYLCPHCGSSSNFRSREETAWSLVGTVPVAVVTTLLGTGLSVGLQLGLTTLLVLVALLLCRACLPLVPTKRRTDKG